MPKATREEIRNRTVDPASLVDKKAVSLEEEAERIKAEIEKGESDVLTPAQEVEQEMLNQAESIAPISRFTHLRAKQEIPQEPQKQPSSPIVHTKEVAMVVESAYKQFLALGHGTETARSLANTYGILELTLELNRIANRFLGDGKSK